MSKRNFLGQEQHSPAQAHRQETPPCRALFYFSWTLVFSGYQEECSCLQLLHGQYSFLWVSRGQWPSFKDFLPAEELPFTLQTQECSCHT